MGDPQIAAAFEEEILESWAEVHAEVREKLASLKASGALGESIAEGFRDFYRLGWLRCRTRAIGQPKK